MVNERRAGMEPCPYEWIGGTWWGRRWMKERVVGDADPYGGWETARVPRDILRYYHTSGRGLAEHGGVGGDRSAGTSGMPSPTGRLRRHNARGNPPVGAGVAERCKAGGREAHSNSELSN